MVNSLRKVLIKHPRDAYINQNKLVSKLNNQSDNYLNTRLIYNQKILKNIINSNLFYETNSGNLPQQEYTFLEVEPGLGSYKWIDVNENNLFAKGTIINENLNISSKSFVISSSNINSKKSSFFIW